MKFCNQNNKDKKKRVIEKKKNQCVIVTKPSEILTKISVLFTVVSPSVNDLFLYK